MIKLSLLDPVMNPWILPMMKFSPALAILLLSFLITIIVTVIYKYTTNQEKMKELKLEQNKIQKELKSLKDKPAQMMKKQKVLMAKNMEYSKHSMKSTLYTLLPLLLIFGWMNAHLAYYSLTPNQDFNIVLNLNETPNGLPVLQNISGITVKDIKGAEKSAMFVLRGEKGEYKALTFDYKNETCSTPLIINEDKEDYIYTKPIVNCKGNHILKGLKIKYEPLRPFGNFDLFGWHPGWLSTYIISSMIFSWLLRKMMKVY